jgi:hypothetical protein
VIEPAQRQAPETDSFASDEVEVTALATTTVALGCAEFLVESRACYLAVSSNGKDASQCISRMCRHGSELGEVVDHLGGSSVGEPEVDQAPDIEMREG